VASINKKVVLPFPVGTSPVRTAGGMGPYSAKQSDIALLRRSVLACLLGENLAYANGKTVMDEIARLIPTIEPSIVAELAVEARTKQKLRHVPLFIARIMAALPNHKAFVGDLLPQIILRADELSEYVAIYKKDTKGKFKLSAQSKIGLAKAFNRFSPYSLGKYKDEKKEVSLKDVLFLSHPKPLNKVQDHVWKELIGGYCENCWKMDPEKKQVSKKSKKPHEFCECGQYKEAKLAIPDTWETELSAGKDKKATWERLILEGKLGANAFLKNMRNMEDVKVEPSIIRTGLLSLKGEWLLPLDFLKAAKYTPRYENEISDAMVRTLSSGTKLPGYTIFIIDVSGSMSSPVSSKSQFTRRDVASAMAMLAAESCERISVYATAGSDGYRTHKTALLPPRHGFALADEINNAMVGSGGIFTRQVLEYVKSQEREHVDRIIIFSDSQDCDRQASKKPTPWADKNYIVDVSAHTPGVNYDGLWTAEVSGWSEHFLAFIAALEGEVLQDTNGDNLQ
jgi:60 kDa SS-A/Ro ribonucleoprotein